MSAENISNMKAAIQNNLRANSSTLRLVNLGLNDKDMPELARLLNENSTFTSVNLGSNNIRNGIAALAECKYLEELYSERNDLGDRGVIALANSNIERLSLNGCNITAKAAQALLERQHPNSLVSLVCCDEIPGTLLEAIKERNKMYKKKEDKEPSKKGFCRTLLSFWSGPKENVGSSSGIVNKKGFEKK